MVEFPEKMRDCCKATIKLSEPITPKCMCEQMPCNTDHGAPFWKCVICNGRWSLKEEEVTVISEYIGRSGLKED